MRKTLVLLSGVLLTVVLAGCGGDDAPTGGEARQIEIDMVDNAYSPDTVEVDRGEQITFVFSNEGTVLHEAYVGTADDQEAHEAEMAGDDSGMDHDMDDMGSSGSSAIEVEPGDSGELTYTFADAGEYLIGCHQPGHYEDGMRLTVEIT